MLVTTASCRRGRRRCRAKASHAPLGHAEAVVRHDVARPFLARGEVDHREAVQVRELRIDAARRAVGPCSIAIGRMPSSSLSSQAICSSRG